MKVRLMEALLRKRARDGIRVTVILVFSLCGASGQLVSSSKTVILDGASPGRVFDGLGAVSAGASSRLLIDYPEPQRSVPTTENRA